MGNPISSSGDPIFYLHHAWLDKIWWDWQSRDLPARLSEMAGENRQRGEFEGQEPCGGVEMFGPRPPEIPYAYPLRRDELLKTDTDVCAANRKSSATTAGAPLP